MAGGSVTIESTMLATVIKAGHGGTSVTTSSATMQHLNKNNDKKIAMYLLGCGFFKSNYFCPP